MSNTNRNFYILAAFIVLIFIILDLLNIFPMKNDLEGNPPDFQSTTRQMPTTGTPDQLSKHYQKINSKNPDDGFFNKWVLMKGRVRTYSYFPADKNIYPYYEIEFMTKDPLPLVKVKISEVDMKKQKFFKSGKLKHGQSLTICAKCVSGDESLVYFDFNQ